MVGDPRPRRRWACVCLSRITCTAPRASASHRLGNSNRGVVLPGAAAVSVQPVVGKGPPKVLRQICSMGVGSGSWVVVTVFVLGLASDPPRFAGFTEHSQ